jgi:CDP-paratose synthetase
MKIILTGATGFLGTHLLKELIKENYELIIIKRHSTNLEHINNRFGRLEAWDLEELEDLFKIHPDVDAIIHAATDYGRDESNPTAAFFANEVFPTKLLALAIRYSISTFINIDTFFSSSKIEYEHLAAYTLSKRHFKEWGRYYANIKKIGFLNLQLFHLYGEGDGQKKFVPRMVASCLHGGELDLTDGLQERDFIYISDAVSAIMTIMVAEAGSDPGYRNYDIGTGSSTSIRNFMEKVKIICCSNVKLNFGALPNRKGEFLNSYADTADLRALGWAPKVGIEMGIEYVVQDITRRNFTNLLKNEKNDC